MGYRQFMYSSRSCLLSRVAPRHEAAGVRFVAYMHTVAPADQAAQGLADGIDAAGHRAQLPHLAVTAGLGQGDVDTSLLVARCPPLGVQRVARRTHGAQPTVVLETVHLNGSAILSRACGRHLRGSRCPAKGLDARRPCAARLAALQARATPQTAHARARRFPGACQRRHGVARLDRPALASFATPQIASAGPRPARPSPDRAAGPAPRS